MGLQERWFRAGVALLFFGAGLLCGCQQLGDNRFDLRAETPPKPKLDFYEVKRKHLSPSQLHPDKAPIRIGSGDVLLIEVLDQPESSEQVLVMPDGMIYYDIAGGVRGDGKTPEELEKELEELLSEQYNAPVVTVTISEFRSRMFTIYGGVARPGSYPLAFPATLLEGLSMAGGVAGSSSIAVDLDRSVVIRGDNVLPVDFSRLVERGDLSQNIYLAPGDLVFLPESTRSSIYVLGAVNRPGAIGWSRTLNIVQAIASVGGPSGAAHVKKMVIIRGSISEPMVASFDLMEIMKGAAPGFTLEPGDILWVPTRPWGRVEQYARTFVDAAVTTIAVRSAREVAGGNDLDRSNVSITVDPVVVQPPPPAPDATP